MRPLLLQLPMNNRQAVIPTVTRLYLFVQSDNVCHAFWVKGGKATFQNLPWLCDMGVESYDAIAFVQQQRGWCCCHFVLICNAEPCFRDEWH